MTEQYMNDDPHTSDIQIQSYLVENYRAYLKEAALVVSNLNMIACLCIFSFYPSICSSFEINDNVYFSPPLIRNR